MRLRIFSLTLFMRMRIYLIGARTRYGVPHVGASLPKLPAGRGPPGGFFPRGHRMRHPSTAATKHPLIVRRMAGFIVEVTEAFGTCTEADLSRRFTRDDIKAHLAAARDLAAERLGTRESAAA